MVWFSLTIIILLSTKLIQATPPGNRDDLQDQEITELKKMMVLQSELIQSQAEMLQQYGKRIASLEKENSDLVKRTEKFHTANEIMESRQSHLKQVDLDTRPEVNVQVNTGQSIEEIEDQENGQLQSPGNQADGKLSRIRRVHVTNVPGTSLEKENNDLVKQTEKLQIANEVIESRLSHLKQVDLDTRPEEDVHVTTGQSIEDIEDQERGQLNSPVNQADGKLLRIRRVANVPGNNLTAVGFYCRLVSPHPLLLGQKQTIDFDDVVTNVGNGYDSRHGYFTAPVAGLYSFTSTVLFITSNNHYMHLAIVKNGEVVGYLQSYAMYDKGTRTVVISLAVGDMVWVRNNVNSSPSIHGDGQSTFAGFLITPFSPGS